MAHRIAEDGRLEDVGKLQLFIHALFVRSEPTILRVLDRMMEMDLFRGRGRPVLVFMREGLAFLPRGEVVSTSRAKDFLDALSKSGDSKIIVSPCVCQEALGRREGTLFKEMTVLYGTEVYERAKGDEGGIRVMSPDEAKILLEALHDEGCIPTFYSCLNSRGWMVVICNCEGKICLPSRAHRLLGGILSPGPDVVSFEADGCIGCGRCVKRCSFEANRLVDGRIVFDSARCYGCGLCVSTCPTEARRLVDRRGYTNLYYPMDFVAGYGSRAAGDG
ncbi:MAG TPA: 4Fe-4S binding protein [Methanothrix sp.]|nr:4Fe-4S binding protein [Methanothrix sp.]HRW81855.1 4Fe-4S binding protein [Methanothrix sp.]